MSSSSVPEGPGSVSGAPNLPEGFTATFASRYVDTGDLRQHVVTGGEGPPLFGSTQANKQLWHFPFNRLAEVNDQLADDVQSVVIPGCGHYWPRAAVD